MNDIIVIGGGISGLYCAYNILKTRPNTTITILEASNRLGGNVNTIYSKDLTYEAGAGRFNDNHKHLNSLISEFNLTKFKYPIKSEHTLVITKQTHSTDFKKIEDTFTSFDSIIQRISHTVKKLHIKDETLINTNLLELAVKLFPELPSIDKYMKAAYPYYSELKWLNALASLDIFTKEFNANIQYYILTCGLTEIINQLSNKIKSYPNTKIVLNAKCTDIILNDNLESESESDSDSGYSIITSNKTYRTHQLILACPKKSLLQFNILKPITPLLAAVITQPLYRIYAKYPSDKDGNYWFSNINKTVTDQKIKYIIPYNMKHGVIMISYTDGKYTNYWINLLMNGDTDKLESELHRQLTLVYPTITIPKKPIWLKHYYWSDAVGYWKKGYDFREISKELIQPLKNQKIYICGENYSLHQGWIEGSLDTASNVIAKVSSKEKARGGGKTYSLEEVKNHGKKSDAWIVIKNGVYDITKWIPDHPGGDIIMSGVGKDATKMFESIGHDARARQILAKYKIGELKKV